MAPREMASLGSMPTAHWIALSIRALELSPNATMGSFIRMRTLWHFSVTDNCY
jgi:hypothetical protein